MRLLRFLDYCRCKGLAAGAALSMGLLALASGRRKGSRLYWADEIG